MEAYQEYRIEELSAQLNAEKTNKDNKKIKLNACDGPASVV